MPICPRCGKTLSTDQALSYHLNRKYKCNSWVCKFCNRNFETRFSLNIHENQCEFSTANIKSSIDIWNQIPIIFYVIDAQNVIRFISKQAEEKYNLKPNDILHSKLDKSVKTHDINGCKMQRFYYDTVVIDVPIQN
jgi:transcription elongation factor Elf1